MLQRTKQNYFDGSSALYVGWVTDSQTSINLIIPKVGN